tara:strand:- start:3920 stop:4651 length:732 start_codon:yes stop_codon:yes gene_type:complete
MRVSRVYTDQELVSGSEITLDGQQAHYLSKVLRLKANAKLILFNGDGFEYPSTIQELSKNSIVVEIHERQLVNSESPLYTILGLGLSRGERMDLAIQKCTELGVNEIIPLFTEFSEVKLQGERLQKKIQHWQQIAISACEQSGRTHLATVHAPQALSAWCSSLDCPLKLIFEPGKATRLPARGNITKVALMIGPEGGFSDQELGLADKNGFQALSLGPRILRTETAPIAALSALQLLWGDFDV